MALGKSSLVVSLPKDWVSSNNLSRGDMLRLEVQRDLSLLIQPALKQRGGLRKITVDVFEGETPDSIIRTVIGCYLNGYTDIELKSNKIFSIKCCTNSCNRS